MGAVNTPLYDLVELSGVGANRTYTTTPGGGGDIIGFVDTATYTDGENNNSATQITELGDINDANAGTLTIDGVDYDLLLADPDNTNVTIGYNGGASSINLSGDSGSSQVVFIQAIPTGGGAARYFMAVDDTVGNLPNITSIQIRSLDFSPAGNDVQINLDQNNLVTACFAEGTRITTPYGSRKVEDLSAGDIVTTMDAGPQPLIWVGSRGHGPRALALNPHLKPIRVPPGVLGAQRPHLVSPQHCLLLNPDDPPAAQRLARARHLAQSTGPLRVAQGTRHVRYVHLMLARHHILWGDGVASESFYPGPIGLAGLGQPERLSLLAHLPDLGRTRPDVAYGPTARPVLRRPETLAWPPLRRTVSAG